MTFLWLVAAFAVPIALVVVLAALQPRFDAWARRRMEESVAAALFDARKVIAEVELANRLATLEGADPASTVCEAPVRLGPFLAHDAEPAVRRAAELAVRERKQRWPS